MLGAVINPLPDFGDECPVNPSLCTQGLTVSVFIKVMESEKSGLQDLKLGEHDLVLGEYKFLLGNIEKHSLHPAQYNGFAVGVKDGRFLITVNSHQHVCSNNQVTIRKYLWSHLVFTWKDPEFLGAHGLEIFVDSSRVSSKPNCVRYTSNRMLLKRLKIGSNEGGLSITAELDHLAIWYKNFQANNSILTAPWVHVIGKIYSYFILVDWN